MLDALLDLFDSVNGRVHLEQRNDCVLDRFLLVHYELLIVPRLLQLLWLFLCLSDQAAHQVALDSELVRDILQEDERLLGLGNDRLNLVDAQVLAAPFLVLATRPSIFSPLPLQLAFWPALDIVGGPRSFQSWQPPLAQYAHPIHIR